MGTEDFDWTGFLREWSAAVLASPIGEGIAESVRQSAWLGFEGASEKAIGEAERRLKIELPPSYRAFLLVSNGWRRLTRSVEVLRGVEQIEWFRKEHRDWIKAYAVPATLGEGEAPAAEYFAYGAHASDFKSSHLKETLQISDVGDAAVWLLNPQIISNDGEWEAWLLANWLPGVRRYRSFLEMMQSEYHQFVGDEWSAPVGVVGELPDEYVGSPGSPKRRVKKRRKPAEPKILNNALSKWTAEELLGFLENPEFDIIHGECYEGLALMGDMRVIEPLFAILHEGGASFAAPLLKKLAPERLRETLLELVGDWKRVPSIIYAAYILSEFKEERAIPLLVDIMRNEEPEWDHATHLVPGLIAGFGEAGFRALVEQLKHDSPIVRRRAASGVMSTHRPEARDLCEKLISDPDARIREMAELAVKILPPKRV